MSKNPYHGFSTRKTPQSKPIPGRQQVKNSAGGYTFAIDDWKRLERFLIMGTEGGTYYVDQGKLTKDNAEAVIRCIHSDGQRVVNAAVTISQAGRAPQNDQALFVLAMCAGLGNQATRMTATQAIPAVARIGTHLFNFCTYVQQFRGWGRLLREGVSNWYTSKDLDRLAYQVIKYRQRDGWTHRDVLRKAHPASEKHNNLFHWITQGEQRGTLPALIGAFEQVQVATSEREVVKLILDHNLPREALPTHWLKDNVAVWEALLQNMPMTAMIRNLGKLTSIGLLKPMGAATGLVTSKLRNAEAIRRARVHPLTVLVALEAYKRGRGVKGSLAWSPVREVIDALDEAFYLAFGNVEPANKSTLIALDVSGSMTWSSNIIPRLQITPRVASAALAMVTARVEPRYAIMGFSHTLVDIPISPRQRLDDVCRTVASVRMGGTDCSLPMRYALDNGLEIDTFIVYTDNETWAGRIHPSQALQVYREKTGIKAKLAVVAMTPTKFSIADPMDAGMLDISGFDTATPNIIANFSKE